MWSGYKKAVKIFCKSLWCKNEDESWGGPHSSSHGACVHLFINTKTYFCLYHSTQFNKISPIQRMFITVYSTVRKHLYTALFMLLHRFEVRCKLGFVLKKFPTIASWLEFQLTGWMLPAPCFSVLLRETLLYQNIFLHHIIFTVVIFWRALVDFFLSASFYPP